MLEPSGIPIREFIYFDREKTEDFVSSLESGLLTTTRMTDSEKSPQLNVGIDFKLQAQRKGRTQEASWEEIRTATPASLFEHLHSLLQQRDMIKLIDASDSQEWEELKVKDLVEVEAGVELSALERLLDMIGGFRPWLETFSPEQIQQPNSQNIFKIQQIYEREEYNVRISPLKAQTDKFIFVASLQREKVRSSKKELEDEYTVFGRVKRKLGRNETFELFNLLPEGIKLPRKQMREFVSKFKEMPPILGKAPKMEDLRVSYPAIIMTPIAIYR